jgi:thymidine kinase
MAKLYFRYGVVGSSKTTQLLGVAHNYKQQNKNALVIKPKLDIRSGDMISSRTGLEHKADILVDEKTDLQLEILSRNNLSCILVDECQFFSKEHIDQLRYIASFENIPVICYGLRTDYMGNLFTGSESLMCLADTIEEIKNTCWYCNKKAIMNLKMINGKVISNGTDAPDLGFEDKYLPVCYKHYYEMID